MRQRLEYKFCWAVKTPNGQPNGSVLGGTKHMPSTTKTGSTKPSIVHDGTLLIQKITKIQDVISNKSIMPEFITQLLK